MGSRVKSRRHPSSLHEYIMEATRKHLWNLSLLPHTLVSLTDSQSRRPKNLTSAPKVGVIKATSLSLLLLLSLCVSPPDAPVDAGISSPTQHHLKQSSHLRVHNSTQIGIPHQNCAHVAVLSLPSVHFALCMQSLPAMQCIASNYCRDDYSADRWQERRVARNPQQEAVTGNAMRVPFFAWSFYSLSTFCTMFSFLCSDVFGETSAEGEGDVIAELRLLPCLRSCLTTFNNSF